MTKSSRKPRPGRVTPKAGSAQPRAPRSRVRASSSAASGDRALAVVGIGASAGGLDAFKRLFSAMPVDSGMAFVLVPHLDPTHESLMAQLLARQTTMPVEEAQDGMAALRDHVYVIPPNADLTINNGVLRVVPPPPRRGSHTAIDFFLRSLSTDQRERAIGIILSGTGSHGTLGLEAIKAAGGLVLVQTPESAEHDQMPRSAIATGIADYILPPEQMPNALLQNLAHPPGTAADATPGEMDQIHVVLRTRAKHDFRGHRKRMLMRRVARRMARCHVDSVARYIDLLQARPEEVQALVKDLAIGVTAFFREPAAFQVLERVVIPWLIQRSGGIEGYPPRPVRVWVPGCATGEEAYSIAILFLEQFAASKKPASLQIFATDLDDDFLDTARTGLYPESIADSLSAERLQRFFVKTKEHRYQVSKALREVITFAPQNVVSDAPFSKLDLISCRNLLIYLEPQIQEKVIALFHFALLERGYLVLGPAESIGEATDRFEPVSKKWRVFRRIGPTRALVDIPILRTEEPAAGPRAESRPRPVAAAAQQLQRALLASFAPAAVLVNRRYEILSVQGPVVDYLEFPPGELTRDLLSMARSGLRTAIRTACEQAVRDHHTATDTHARVKRQATYLPCTITARSVADGEGLLLVTFHDQPRRRVLRVKADAGSRSLGDETVVVRQLEYELKATREDLQGTIDELESSNEELKASHEEVMSMNEELQSTNEEMESSKEELQSLNEELSTVNSQLQEKLVELDLASNDMVNLLASTDIATVFLDTDFHIKRFTPTTARLLNLLTTDLGRPLRDIALRVTDPALFEDCRQVLEKLAPVEAVVRADDGRAYLRRVLPYRTADNRISGIVITWVDITQRLTAEAETRHLGAVLQDSNDGVVLLDLEGRIIGWNRGAEALYGYGAAEARTMHVQDLVPEPFRDMTGDLINRVGSGDTVSESLETQRRTKDGRLRDIWLTITLLRDGSGRPDAIVTTDRDITELKEGIAARHAARLYQQVIEELPAGAVLREDSRLTMNRAAEAITGYQRHELDTVDAWRTALHGGQAEARRSLYETGRTGERAEQPFFLEIIRKDGATRHVSFNICRLDHDHELWMLLDLTEQDHAEQALRRSEDYLRSIVNTAVDAIITIDQQGTIDTFNLAAERMFGYPAAEVVGRNVRLLMPQPYRDEHDGYLARYLKTGEARVIGIGREVVGLRKDGTTFPLDLSISQIDPLQRFTGILRDLSERRKLEWRLAESQVEERRYVARELHDGMGGHMTGIGLLAQTLHSHLAKTSSALASRAEDLVRSIDEAQKQLRSIVRELMPVEATPDGLMAALQELATQAETQYNLRCQFRCARPVYLDDPAAAKNVFRIVQEALNNAVRHAKPKHIVINLSQTGQRLEVTVSDDGSGLKEIQGARPGIGLDSMWQRAHLLGGDLSIQPRVGGGTILTCWVPLPPSGTDGHSIQLAGPA